MAVVVSFKNQRESSSTLVVRFALVFVAGCEVDRIAAHHVAVLGAEIARCRSARLAHCGIRGTTVEFPNDEVLRPIAASRRRVHHDLPRALVVVLDPHRAIRAVRAVRGRVHVRISHLTTCFHEWPRCREYTEVNTGAVSGVVLLSVGATSLCRLTMYQENHGQDEEPHRSRVVHVGPLVLSERRPCP